jgi:hypothetical protein
MCEPRNPAPPVTSTRFEVASPILDPIKTSLPVPWISPASGSKSISMTD